MRRASTLLLFTTLLFCVSWVYGQRKGPSSVSRSSRAPAARSAPSRSAPSRASKPSRSVAPRSQSSRSSSSRSAPSRSSSSRSTPSRSYSSGSSSRRPAAQPSRSSSRSSSTRSRSAAPRTQSSRSYSSQSRRPAAQPSRSNSRSATSRTRSAAPRTQSSRSYTNGGRRPAAQPSRSTRPSGYTNRSAAPRGGRDYSRPSSVNGGRRQPTAAPSGNRNATRGSRPSYAQPSRTARGADFDNPATTGSRGVTARPGTMQGTRGNGNAMDMNRAAPNNRRPGSVDARGGGGPEDDRFEWAGREYLTGSRGVNATPVDPGGRPSDFGNGTRGVNATPTGGRRPGPAGNGTVGVNARPTGGRNVGGAGHGYVCPPTPGRYWGNNVGGNGCAPPPPCPSSTVIYGGFGTRYNYSWCDTYWGWSRTYNTGCGMRYWYGSNWVTGWSFRSNYCGFSNVYVRAWARKRILLELDPSGEFCWEIVQRRVWVPGYYTVNFWGNRIYHDGYYVWETVSTTQVWDTWFDWGYISAGYY